MSAPNSTDAVCAATVPAMRSSNGGLPQTAPIARFLDAAIKKCRTRHADFLRVCDKREIFLICLAKADARVEAKAIFIDATLFRFRRFLLEKCPNAFQNVAARAVQVIRIAGCITMQPQSVFSTARHISGAKPVTSLMICAPALRAFSATSG